MVYIKQALDNVNRQLVKVTLTLTNICAVIVFQGAHCVSAHIPQTAQSMAQSPSSLMHLSKAGLASLCLVHCASVSQWLMNRLVRSLGENVNDIRDVLNNLFPWCLNSLNSDN